MNWIQKFASLVIPVPACTHEPEIHRLKNEVQAARLFRDHAERQFGDAVDSMNAASARATRLSAEVAQLTAHRDLLHRQVTDAADRERELLETIEEQTGQIVLLGQQLADRGSSREQHPLFEAPPAPVAEPVPDEVIGDHLLELVYRLVGIWFEGRHHWVLARGEERIKAPIHDKEFLAQMQRGEVRFVSGDTLLADFRVITYRRASDGEVYADHSVERVKRVIHPHEQVELPLGQEPAHV